MFMRKLLIVLFLLTATGALFAQDPGYSITVKVKPEEGYTYQYSSKLCSPKTKSIDTQWHEYYRSKIDISEFYCEDLRNEMSEGGFRYADLMHAYECVSNVTIIQTGSETSDTMRIVFPLKVESFVTIVELMDIEFKPGVYDLSDGFDYDTSNFMVMTVRDDFEWVDIVESNLISY